MVITDAHIIAPSQQQRHVNLATNNVLATVTYL